MTYPEVKVAVPGKKNVDVSVPFHSVETVHGLFCLPFCNLYTA